MSLLAKAADRVIELIVPHATASATTRLYCACIDHRKWYADCQDVGGQLKCGGCNVKTSTKC
jgi:hypothetical protein